MKIAANLLRRWTDLPEDQRALRELLDDLGLEVKRVERHAVAGLVFTLELLANRGDHHCYAGVAREITGRTGGALREVPRASLQIGEPPVPLRVETPLGMRYTATLLERFGQDGPLDPEVGAPLYALGQEPLGAAIDATNLVNTELGQPTHAFDADRIKGGITVRLSRAGERAWPLFQPGHVDVPEGTLVIADDEKILAIAGVIGCEDSKTTRATTRVLLESATFDPVAVRIGGRALGIHTDASARFERGSDPELALAGAARVVHLLEGTGAWRRVGPTGVVGDFVTPDRRISLDLAAASELLGVPLDYAEAAERLGRYGFEIHPAPGGLVATVPSWRIWDVEHDADLLEELAKSIGYNNTPISLPPVDLGAVPTAEERVKATCSAVLVSAGLYEALTDGFYSRGQLDVLGLPDGHPLLEHVETSNALDRAYSLLKNNPLVQAVDAFASNLRRKVEDVKLFEFTRVFEPNAGAANGVCDERKVLWAIVGGQDLPRGWGNTPRPADIFTLKALVRELGVALSLPLGVGASDPSHPLSAALHPGRQGVITRGDAVVGVLGEVHPSVCKAAGIKRERPCYLEINLDALTAPGARPAFEEPSALQPIDRSLAFTLPHGFRAAQVADLLRASGPPWLSGVAMTDVFHHEEEGRPLRTVTYAMRFEQSAEGRTADEVNATVRDLLQAVLNAAGPAGVKLRA